MVHELIMIYDSYFLFLYRMLLNLRHLSYVTNKYDVYERFLLFQQPIAKKKYNTCVNRSAVSASSQTAKNASVKSKVLSETGKSNSGTIPYPVRLSIRNSLRDILLAR